MINVKRKKGESFESLYRRFSRRMQQSGNLLEVRKVRFRTKQPNKTKVKQSALRRLVTGARRAYLIRIGQMEETVHQGQGSSRRR